MSDLQAKLIFQQLTQAFAASPDFPRREVERRQTALLERLVRHAHTNVPFYRDSGRLKPLFRADGGFDLAGWSDVPVLTRNEAKANEDALHARVTPPDMGELAAYSTSGSTGTPLKFRQTLAQRVASEVLINRALLWNDLWPMQAFAVSKSGAPASEPPLGILIVLERARLRGPGRDAAASSHDPCAGAAERRCGLGGGGGRGAGCRTSRLMPRRRLGPSRRDADADRARPRRQGRQSLFGERTRPHRRRRARRTPARQRGDRLAGGTEKRRRSAGADRGSSSRRSTPSPRR